MINRETVALNPKDFIVAIDQALDSTGVCVLLPSSCVDSRVIQGLSKLYRGDASEEEIVKALSSDFNVSPGGRKQDYGVGTKVGDAFYFHFVVESETTDQAEWLQTMETTEVIKEILKEAMVLAESLGLKLLVVTESIALHGSKLTVANLPILGTVYSMLWAGIASLGITNAGDINGSQWKKYITGSGKTKKKEANAFLQSVAFDYRIKTDDEMDAISLAITAAHDKDSVAYRNGRMRPTSFGKALKAEKKAKQKARKLKAVA